jgi:hypothetical protein
VSAAQQRELTKIAHSCAVQVEHTATLRAEIKAR